MKRYLIAVVGLILTLTTFQLKAQIAKFISVKGRNIIGPDNKPFLMRGTNLGNWLIPEGYMFKFKVSIRQS